MTGPTDNRTDEEVAKDVQAGDTEAFGVLVTRYEARLLRYARKFLHTVQDAEDLVQEVFIRAYENIRSFDVSRRFSPWIYRIAHNAFVNALRARRAAPLSFFDPDTIFPHPVSTQTADKELAEKDLARMLEEGLSGLDAKYREPMVLFYYEGFDYREIAEVMRIPVSTVGIRLMRGKKMLRKSFGKKGL